MAAPIRHSVRPATRSDHPTLASVLARSFFDDPVVMWLMPNERTRTAQLVQFYRAELTALQRRGAVVTTEEYAGAALWAPPGEWRTPTADVVRQLPRMLLAFRSRVRRALELLEAIEAVHPRQDHWFLALLGTDPDRQGQGVGGALIEEYTRRCDVEGIGAYLESSKERNVAYYERFGFRVTGEVSTGDSPVLWSMWRDPQPPEV